MDRGVTMKTRRQEEARPRVLLGVVATWTTNLISD
jgi:hypothetical protein